MANNLITKQQTNHPRSMNSKRKTCQPEGRLSFLVEMDPRRKPISNVSNLKEGFYRKSYTFWKNGPK